MKKKINLGWLIISVITQGSDVGRLYSFVASFLMMGAAWAHQTPVGTCDPKTSICVLLYTDDQHVDLETYWHVKLMLNGMIIVDSDEFDRTVTHRRSLKTLLSSAELARLPDLPKMQGRVKLAAIKLASSGHQNQMPVEIGVNDCHFSAVSWDLKPQLLAYKISKGHDGLYQCKPVDQPKLQVKSS